MNQLLRNRLVPLALLALTLLVAACSSSGGAVPGY
jgi:predicted small secreted protein